MNRVKVAEYLSSILPADWPTSIDGHEVPSIDHCVGSGKLLGEEYGPAIADACGIRNSLYVEVLTILSSLMRTYIVLDDFMRDSGITPPASNRITKIIDRTGGEIRSLIASLGENSDLLWREYLDRYENACLRFSSLDIFDAVQDKCSFVFLPFEFRALRQSQNVQATKKAVRKYLFALQLLDDFHDVSEDQCNVVNHNLFLLQTNKDEWRFVTANRVLIAPLLLDYIAAQLEKAIQALPAGSIIQSRMLLSYWWLLATRARFNCPNLCHASAVFPNTFEDFRFLPMAIKSHNTSLNALDGLLNMVRAETMHVGRV